MIGMTPQGSSVSRRRFLAGTSVGIAGIGVLNVRSPVVGTARAKPGSGNNGRESSNEWTQYRSGSGRTGVIDTSAPTGAFTPEWTIDEGDVGQPVVDGTSVYVVTSHPKGGNSQLNAISLADGSTRWQADLSDKRGASPSIPPAVIGDAVYLSTKNGTRAFNANSGSEIWNSDKSGEWLVCSGDRLYLSGSDATFTVLSVSDGSVVWEGGMDSDLSIKHAIADGTLYLGIATGMKKSAAVALDANSGQHKWTQVLDSGNPQLVASKNGVLAATNTVLYSLDPESGAVSWKESGGELGQGEFRNIGSPAIDGNRVYALVDTTLSAHDIASGKQQWSVEAAGEIAVAEDSIYSVDSIGSTLVVFDKNNGTKRMQFEYQGDGMLSDRTIVPTDGMVLVGMSQYYGTQPRQPLLALSGE